MTIRLMREIEVPETPRDRVFRASRLCALLFVVGCVGVCSAMIWFGWPRPRLAYYFGAVILILLLASHRFIFARFQPSNWLVRVSNNGLFVHFRSYLNNQLSGEDPTVAFVPYPDIRSARLVRERVKTRDSADAITTQFRRCIELELAVEPAPLATALAVECARPGVRVRNWYGSSATLYKDYPVLMQSPPFLRIEWKVVPGASAFLETLRPRIEIAPAIVASEDFTDLEGLTPKQQEQRLRDLDQRGQTIAAVYTARKLYALDLAAATKFVDALREESKS